MYCITSCCSHGTCQTGEVVPPSSKLVDVFPIDSLTGKRGKEISVTLLLAPKRTTPMFIGQDKPPEQTTWAAEAFNFSAHGVKIAKALKKKDDEEEAERDRQIRYIRDMLNKQKFERLKRLMITDMQLPDTVCSHVIRYLRFTSQSLLCLLTCSWWTQVKTSFEAEWGDIRVEALTENPQEMAMIKNMLACNWVALSDL